MDGRKLYFFPDWMDRFKPATPGKLCKLCGTQYPKLDNPVVTHTCSPQSPAYKQFPQAVVQALNKHSEG